MTESSENNPWQRLEVILLGVGLFFSIIFNSCSIRNQTDQMELQRIAHTDQFEHEQAILDFQTEDVFLQKIAATLGECQGKWEAIEDEGKRNDPKEFRENWLPKIQELQAISGYRYGFCSTDNNKPTKDLNRIPCALLKIFDDMGGANDENQMNTVMELTTSTLIFLHEKRQELKKAIIPNNK